MYNYRYTNKLYQFGHTTYTLILEDLESVPIKTVRIEKSFKMAPEQIDKDFLYDEARKEILNLLNQVESEVAIIDEEPIEE